MLRKYLWSHFKCRCSYNQIKLLRPNDFVRRALSNEACSVDKDAKDKNRYTLRDFMKPAFQSIPQDESTSEPIPYLNFSSLYGNGQKSKSNYIQ